MPCTRSWEGVGMLPPSLSSDVAQVRDLMIYIEAGRSIAAGGEEMKDASLLPVPPQQATPQPKRRTSKRR